MKRYKVIGLVVIAFLIVAFFLKSPGEELRVRVIPNSNSQEDLLIKEEIKLLAIEYLEENYDESLAKYINNINKNIEDFSNLLNSTYNRISVSLEKHKFFNKTYNGSSLKNEEVLTFLVIINEGKGDNWWGSIYPKFLEMSSSEVTQYKSLIIELIKRRKNNV